TPYHASNGIIREICFRSARNCFVTMSSHQPLLARTSVLILQVHLTKALSAVILTRIAGV
ncbi:MAG: hypothetical protein II685_04275, partial [Clostridia bacterium]|nr:hypothetical protein [Clostridia bacterium]